MATSVRPIRSIRTSGGISMRRPGSWPPLSPGAVNGCFIASWGLWHRISDRCCASYGGVIIVHADCVPLGGPVRPEVAVHRLMCPLVSLTAALTLNLAALEAWAADAVTEFYRGKSVALLIGFGPGGGYDTYARVLAHH